LKKYGFGHSFDHGLIVSQDILRIQDDKRHLTTTLLSGSSAVKVRHTQTNDPLRKRNKLKTLIGPAKAASRKAKRGEFWTRA
jgi:hypothetical protein